ncbi:hypothetical protein M408DRAFT_184959 [Serendipita vermifera MAFF 305830]|uniref:TPPC8 first Ig-like domain-containing protein n=1 Tax=Serendipita vermifera MAFF 305830 TaxID=933852 RepID=A0A0C2XUW6_SERVB|nr:hypothetical protein M408DRAFT_184959 [Serendipita vermifera MAFF 305830]
MAAKLPSSLSPHVTTLLSPDLIQLLTDASLPPLHHIFQSYSPLPLVTTRTTAFTPVQHSSFHLRFSNLEHIQIACKEDEETRSSRFIDWLGTRIARRAGKWVEDASQRPLDASTIRTPWWEDMRRCVEGEWTPSKWEGWNHPVAVIYAVSTSAPNPLQAISVLAARPLELPIWVDSMILRCILIVHTSNSPLSKDECTALYNAVKKQHGSHVHLLNLTLERPVSPIPIIPMPPQLPLPNAVHVPFEVPDTSELWMSEADAQATGKFVREFLTQSLLLWMEKSVLEWNEAFANNKRLGSRIFSSTRRMVFGSSTQTAPATPTGFNSGGFSPTSPSPSPFVAQPPPQQRRLAEFATFLGDYKVAVTVWESLRKEGKGGAAILPLLLTPSTSNVSYALQALAPIAVLEPSAAALLSAMVCAVRWEAGVQDLTSIGGEKWLVWAASTADEASTALLIGQAAYLSRLKGSRRTSSLWYVMAAHRLEKCGIKALTAYFLREAHTLYKTSIPKALSPSYAEAEQWPKDRRRKILEETAFPVVLTNIEHSLGRIQYSSGDTESAVRLFLGLLQYSLQMDSAATDPIIIDDFRQALEHLESTHNAGDLPEDLMLPIQFCVASDSKIRLRNHMNDIDTGNPVWEGLETRWSSSREKGKGTLQQASAEVGQPFWVDIVVQNPIEAEVVLREFSLRFSPPAEGTSEATPNTLAVSEILEEVHLLPKERRLVSVGITPLVTGPLGISTAQYSFISKLPVTESLAIPGKRLNETSAQRQDVAYAPPKPLTVSVKQGGSILDVELLDDHEEADHDFYDEDDIILLQGEIRRVFMRITNRGVGEVDRIWLTMDESVSVWVDENDGVDSKNGFVLAAEKGPGDIAFANNMHKVAPISLSLEKFHGSSSLSAGGSFDIPLLIHVPDEVAITHFRGLLTYSQREGPIFFTRLSRQIEVIPTLNVSNTILPNPSASNLYALRVEVENITDELDIGVEYITSLATEWSATAKSSSWMPLMMPPKQMHKISLRVDHKASDGAEDITTLVKERVSDFLLGKKAGSAEFPEAVLNSTIISNEGHPSLSPYLLHFILASRRRCALQTLIAAFPTIPPNHLQLLFPLYSPYALDLVLFWNLPSSNRHGFIPAFDIQLGVGHGLLNEVIERAVESKGKSMYAETKREHELLLRHFRESEWNRETNPVVVSVVPIQSTIEHDFTRGACLVPVTFKLYNYSSTNAVRYILRLSPPRASIRIQTSFPATYTGLLTHRGILLPTEQCSIAATLRASSAGHYALTGWRLEVELGEQGSTASEWITRARYLQGPADDEDVVLVKATSMSV